MAFPLRYVRFAVCFACVSAALAMAGRSFATYDEAEPVLRSFADALPAGLKSSDLAIQRKAWPDWVSAHDREIRGRLLRGDEDTVVNWLMFGTSFTKEPKA